MLKQFPTHYMPQNLLLTLLMGIMLGHSAMTAKTKTAFDFQNERASKSWFSVNDGVMGGISKGGFKITDDATLLFTGELSLENNGGFASIRSQDVDINLKGATAIIVNARGDGRTYWVGLREANQRGASSFRAYMPTVDGELKSVRIPLSDFKYQTFGRSLPMRPLNPMAVESIGFTIADKNPGDFQLEIISIEIDYGNTPPRGSTLVDIASDAGNFETLLAAAKKAGLVGALSGDGPLTVFAPTDEAFAALPEGTVSSLLKPENKQQLADILKYHVIAGQVSLADALKAEKALTLQGEQVTIAFKDGSVRIGGAKLVTADITASNGIIHVIDQVLLPPAPDTDPLSPDALISLAIERGVPQFNEGNAKACADIYEITVEALRTHPDVPNKTKDDLAKTMAKVKASDSPHANAWTLRYALDRALHNMASRM